MRVILLFLFPSLYQHGEGKLQNVLDFLFSGLKTYLLRNSSKPQFPSSFYAISHSNVVSHSKILNSVRSATVKYNIPCGQPL